ncbi:MAG TPA: hypothetical protein VF749_13770 [Candidatus Acidoferrum sp.]
MCEVCGAFWSPRELFGITWAAWMLGVVTILRHRVGSAMGRGTGRVCPTTDAGAQDYGDSHGPVKSIALPKIPDVLVLAATLLGDYCPIWCGKSCER